MGRPKRDVAMTSVRISEPALELVREAAKIKKEAIVDYLTRIAIEHAKADLAAEEKRLRDVRQQKGLGKEK